MSLEGSVSCRPAVESSWNVMAHSDAREGKWRGNWWMEWIASSLHTTLEHGVSSITTADAHTSTASSQLNWRPRRFKWTRPFRRKTKSGFCACAITFQTQSTRNSEEWQESNKVRPIDSFQFVANLQPNRALNEWSNLPTHPIWFPANLLLFGAHSDNTCNVGPFACAYLHNPVSNQLTAFYLNLLAPEFYI